MRRVVPASLLLAVLLVVTGCRSDPAVRPATTAPPATSEAPPTTVAVQRDILASDDDPPGAPGRTLTLVRYTIAPGAELVPHVHPGVQLASIQAGSLAYTVMTGTATVKRADGAVEEITGPTSTTLAVGDAVTETGDMVHFGANKTDAPVVILSTLLTETGRDLAVPVTAVPTTVPG
ncbi:MAG: cupin domain-containing protein [Acidimicrobiales bacterium]